MRGLLAFLIATLTMSASIVPAALGQDKNGLTFKANVSDLRLKNNSRAKNRRQGDCVRVTLPGRLDKPPVPVALIERKAAAWTTPEDAVASIRSANTSGEKEWILENFSRDDRARVKALIDDPAILKRNLDYYKMIQNVEIMGSAELRGHHIVLVREATADGKARMAPVTLVKTASGWKQTNALSADETFDLILASLRGASMDGTTFGECDQSGGARSLLNPPRLGQEVAPAGSSEEGMTLEQQLNDTLTQAIKDRDRKTADVVRMLKTKLLERRTAKGFSGAVDDALVLDVIGAYRKQLQKAVVEFEKAGDRGAEQAARLRSEIAFCERYLPKGLDEATLRALVRERLDALGITDPKQVGRLVGDILKTHKGQVEANEVKRVAEALLTTS
jgi:uncharacterized protein YqeY